MTEQGVPRPNFEIYSDGEKIGQLTSGTFSPLLKCGVGMGYVEVSQAQDGSIVDVKIRDRLARGKISAFPLYDAGKYGYKRQIAS
jgi:aminomethyltransferase